MVVAMETVFPLEFMIDNAIPVLDLNHTGLWYHTSY